LVIFERGSCFLFGLAWTLILLFVLISVAGMTGMGHQAQLLLVEMGSHKLFA
jgi:hypothetical protein